MPAFNFFDEREARATAHHLRIAAEMYDRDADASTGQDRIVEHFRAQAHEARSIANRISLSVGDDEQWPMHAYVLVQPDNIIGRVTRGQPGYTPIPHLTPAEADALNLKGGVSPALRESMVAGSMFGWHVPGADPKTGLRAYRKARPLAQRKIAQP